MGKASITRVGTLNKDLMEYQFMVSGERVLELGRYYLALFILVFGGLRLIEEILGSQLAFWQSLIVIVILVVVFGQLLRQIGWEPSGWR